MRKIIGHVENMRSVLQLLQNENYSNPSATYTPQGRLNASRCSQSKSRKYRITIVY